MVKATRASSSTGLRWSQIAHSVVLPPFTIFAALSDSYVFKLDSGETFDIAAHHGLLGQILLWSVVGALVAQIISLWRLSTVSVILYLWFGTWLVLIAALLAMSGEFLTKQVENLSTGGQWVLNFLGVDFEIAQSKVETGNAWIWILVSAVSMTAIGIWQFIEKLQFHLETQRVS